VADVILETQKLCKNFGPVRVLFDMDFELRRGEIHAVIGENGAGKSTLVKIVSGYHLPTEGKLLLDGKTVRFLSTKDAEDAGICMIHQEFNLANDLTVEENIFLGKERRRGPFLDRRQMQKESRAILASLETTVHPRARVKNLSVSQKQMVEIAKAVSRKADILIMDEPTAVLTRTEIQVLFRLMRSLQEQGVSIIYISHKLDEVKEIADRVTVLRDGYKVGVRSADDLSEEEMAAMMVGRDIEDMFPDRGPAPRELEVLRAEAVSSPGSVEDCSFALCEKEILGFAGLVGAGRTELMEAMLGLRERSGGRLLYRGETLSLRSYRNAIDKRIVYLSEDRKGKGLLIDKAMGFNLTLLALRRYSRSLGLIDEQAEDHSLLHAIEEFDIRAPSQRAVMQTLSGGNQQKVALGKIMEVEPDVLILDEPTRGIDVGTKQQIYFFINELAKGGKSVIVISSELPEIIGLCHRVVVMRSGRIVGEVVGADINEEEIMRYAMGIKGGNHREQEQSTG